MRMALTIPFSGVPLRDLGPLAHAAEEEGYDSLWSAEATELDGITPLVVAAQHTERVRLVTGIISVYTRGPAILAQTAAALADLSGGRFVLGLGSGYRQYEFEGFGVDFEGRRDIQEEALPLLLDLLHKKRADHRGKHFRFKIDGEYELFPHALQQPHPPIFLAGATDRSIAVAARMGFGLLLSTWTPFEGLARQIAHYRSELAHTPAALRKNPSRGHVDVARYVYVADTDARARAESEAVILRHLAHFSSGHTSGYLGTVNAGRNDYDGLLRDVILHGSRATVIEKIERLRAIGADSLMLHYPPWYGADKAIASLEKFAAEVMPKFAAAARAGEGLGAKSARPDEAHAVGI